MIIAWYTDGWWAKEDANIDCTPEEMTKAVKGYICIDSTLLGDPRDNTIAGIVSWMLHCFMLRFTPSSTLGVLVKPCSSLVNISISCIVYIRMNIILAKDNTVWFITVEICKENIIYYDKNTTLFYC